MLFTKASVIVDKHTLVKQHATSRLVLMNIRMLISSQSQANTSENTVTTLDLTLFPVNRYYITWCYLNYNNTEHIQIFFTLMMIKQIENVETHNFNSFLP